jgi:hypothetical protein
MNLLMTIEELYGIYFLNESQKNCTIHKLLVNSSKENLLKYSIKFLGGLKWKRN